MREALRRKRQRGQVSSTYSIPAPINGWNARDSIASMRPGDAVVLKNWFPTTADVMLRKGMAEYATDLPDEEAETLMVYRPPTGSHEMFAIADGEIFDVSVAGAVGAAVVTGLSDSRWQYTNATTAGGNFIIAVNGLDAPQLYDGATWTSITGVSTPAIIGVTTTTLVNVTQYKGRTWYIQKDTLDAWYSGAGALTGALTKFSLMSVFKNGGYLVAQGAWTLDSGSGVDDLAVFITSTGEVAVYQGTNPASDFALVGVFNIGRPIGYRCFKKYKGDLLIITEDGVDIASRALLAARADKNTTNTAKISGAAQAAVELYSANFGWEVCHFPAAGMLLLNIPAGVGLQEQYVMNTTTGAWCQFTEWHANCFEVFNNELYFGTTGEVRKAWTGTSDLGSNIVGEIVTAFDYFGSTTGIKAIRMIRPVIGWDSNPAEFLVGVDVDFIIREPTGTISLSPSTAGVWDVGLWDIAVWGGNVDLNRVWYSAFGLGYAIAAHLKISSRTAEVRLAAIDFVFERGGIL